MAGELDTLRSVHSSRFWKKFTLINYDPQSRKLWRRDLVYSGGDQIATVRIPRSAMALLDASYPKLALANDVKDFANPSPTACFACADGFARPGIRAHHAPGDLHHDKGN